MKHLSVVSQVVKTMSSLEISNLVESRHDSVKRTINRLALLKIITFTPMVETNSQNKEVSVYHVNERDSYVVVAQLSPKFTAKLVDRWQELECKDAVAIPSNYIEALEALVVSEKEKQLAIDTKAEIGSRREATSMNTASQAVKKANKLEVELDKSKEYSSMKRMEIITGEKFNWRKLKATAQALGVPIIKIPDSNYEEVNAYHYTVWLEAYGLEVE